MTWSDLEQQRVAALHDLQIVGCAPEAAFDDLVALAAQLCESSMAIVSLVDEDRLWLQAKVGVEVCESPRDTSFCTHALAGPDLLVVPDTLLDERFRELPAVLGDPRVRSYVGAPLVNPAGLVLGTLCVLDREPKHLTEVQLNQLAVLARQVVTQLELRRRTRLLAEQVAARVQVTEDLAASRRLLDGVLRHTDVCVFVKDLEGRFVLSNPAVEQLMGQPGAVLGRTDHDLFPAELADVYRSNDLFIAETGTRQTFAEQAVDAEGRMRSYLSTKFPLLDEEGRVYAVAGVSSDVTELAEERAAHVEAEQRWKALVERSPVAVAVIGEDGLFEYANPQAQELYGADTGADTGENRGVVGQPAAVLVPPGRRGLTTALFCGVLTDGAGLTAHRSMLRTLDGRDVHIEVNAARVTYRGRPAVQVELRDVSVQVAAETALRASETRFRALFASSPAGTVECLPDGTLVDVNPRLCEMLGFDRDELVGRPSSEMLAEPGEQERLDAAEQARSTTSGCFIERRYRRKDGSVLPVLVGVGVVRDEAGDVVRVLGTAIDVSDRVAAESQLRAAHAELETRQAFTTAVLDSVGVGIVACDAAGRVTLLNDATVHWHQADPFGQPPAEVAPERLSAAFDLMDQEGQPLAADQVPLLRVLRGEQVQDVEMLIAPAGRPATRVLCTGRPLQSRNGRLLGAVVAMTDITAVRAQTQALQASEQRFRTTFANDPAGLAILDPRGRPLQVNPALCQMVGVSEVELLALPDLSGLTSSTDRTTIEDLFVQAGRNPGTSLGVELSVTGRRAEGIWVHLTVTALPDPQVGSCLLLQLEDITTRRATEERLTRQALHDALTDLPNRTMLMDRTRRALADLVDGPGERVLAALFCDLDGFKAVNDTYGHAAGDHVLVQVACRLTRAMRPTDTVGRLGGDEFVVLCEHLRSPHEAATIARRIEQAVNEPILWGGEVLAVTASVGIAYGAGDLLAEELIENADAAMYQVKAAGRRQRTQLTAR